MATRTGITCKEADPKDAESRGENKAEEGQFVAIDALSHDTGFNTLARSLTSSSNKLLGWLLGAWEKQWPMLNEEENSTFNVFRDMALRAFHSAKQSEIQW